MISFEHLPVMPEKCIDGLDIKPDGIYLDGTAGGGGPSELIAKRLTEGGRLIATDKDPDAVAAAGERLAGYACAEVVESDFAELDRVLDERGIEKIDGILLDLGVSSHQLDCAGRGFSYNEDAPLDMRMSQKGLSAADIVNTWTREELAAIIREYGEERFAASIASRIVREREKAPIDTTLQLARIVTASMPAASRRDGNPCKRTFQAIRIAVNSELEKLSEALDRGFERLKPGGRFVILTFHSLEDRMVKQRFAEWAQGCVCPPDFPVCVCGRKPRARIITKKPEEASAEELERNRRSRSAKLRIAEKL